MSFPRRRLEPVAQRVRVRIGKRVILDTTYAQLLFEDKRHPWRAVPKDALPAPLAGPAVADDIDGCWWAIELDGAHATTGPSAPGTPHPLTAPPSPASLSFTTTSPTTGWKKNIRVYGMPKNPYHRVDARGPERPPTGAAQRGAAALGGQQRR
jgi:hypothetical protein